MSIFVQMTSYKNFDVIATIRNCIEKCSDKDNLYFGICLQQNEPSPPELNHPRIKVSVAALGESPGWARSKAQSFYDGQDYVLQVDSGSRFLENWDLELIGALSAAGSPKAMITNFPNRYNPASGELEQQSTAYKVHVYSLSNQTLFSWPNPMKNATAFSRSPSINESFFFARGEHSRECLYDPQIYASESEAAMAIRSFTLGYDFYCHFKPVVWRDYSVRPAHWQDDPLWLPKDRASKSKFADLVAGRAEDFGLGSERSVRDFELYSGIDFVNKRIQRSTISGSPPPCKYENEEQWNGEYMKDYSITVSWDINEIEKCDDYDYWYFAVEDEGDQTLHRQDFRIEQDADLISFNKNYKKIGFRIVGGKIPRKICVWPVSKSKGWLKKSKFDLSADAL
jgi:hypothetical protein